MQQVPAPQPMLTIRSREVYAQFVRACRTRTLLNERMVTSQVEIEPNRILTKHAHIVSIVSLQAKFDGVEGERFVVEHRSFVEEPGYAGSNFLCAYVYPTAGLAVLAAKALQDAAQRTLDEAANKLRGKE